MSCLISLTVCTLLLSERDHLQDSWCQFTWPLLVTSSHLVLQASHPMSKLFPTCGPVHHFSGSPDMHREMWEYLSQVATFLTNMGKVLRTLPSSEKSLVRLGLSSTTRRYSSSYSSRGRKKRTPRTGSKAIPFITGKDGQLLPGT